MSLLKAQMRPGIMYHEYFRVGCWVECLKVRNKKLCRSVVVGSVLLRTNGLRAKAAKVSLSTFLSFSFPPLTCGRIDRIPWKVGWITVDTTTITAIRKVYNIFFFFFVSFVYQRFNYLPWRLLIIGMSDLRENMHDCMLHCYCWVDDGDISVDYHGELFI